MKKLSITLILLSFLASCTHGGTMKVFPTSSRPEKVIYHIDLLTAERDTRFAATVLQGLVNREGPRLFISQHPGWHGPDQIPMWIEDLKDRGHEIVEISFSDALEKFVDCYEGAVLYDIEADSPSSKHKTNAITMYCSLHDLIPVTEEINKGAKLSAVKDIRKKYDTAFDAYSWAYCEMWQHADHKIVAHTHPDQMVLRDYCVANKIMPFFITRDMDDAEIRLTARFIEEAGPNAAVMGCWGGYSEEPKGRLNEAQLQRYVSSYGNYMIVTDGCHNTTVFSGLGYEHTALPERVCPKLEEDKVYVVFHITDGDNLQWLMQSFVSDRWWHNPFRGKVPISWSMNPASADLIPMLLEHCEKTATEMDELCMVGLGLTAPSLYGRELESGPENLFTEYLELTDRYMKRTGMSSVHFGDTSNIPITRADFETVAKNLTSADIILGDYGRMVGVYPDNADFLTENGTVVLRTLAQAPHNQPLEECARSIADDIIANTPDGCPAFMYACLVNWYVTPETVYLVSEILGEKYVPVLPSEMAELYKQAHNSGK